MPKRKIAIALSDWLLVEVDDYAGRSELSRSAVIEEATARYLHARRAESDEREYRREALEALEDMRAFGRERASSEPEDAPSSLELLRALRARGRRVS